MTNICQHYTFTVLQGLLPPGPGPNACVHSVMLRPDKRPQSTDEPVQALFAQGWTVGIEGGHTYTIYNSNLDEDQLIVALHEMGFKSDKELDRRYSGRSVFDSPIMMARDQKEALRQALEGVVSPTTPPSKM